MSKQFWLQLSDASGKADQLLLRFDEPPTALTLGSDPEANLRVAVAGVEPRQCVFRLSGDGTLTFENVGRSTPALLNGGPALGVKTITSGDRIEFAGLLVRVGSEATGSAKPGSTGAQHPTLTARTQARPTPAQSSADASALRPATDSGNRSGAKVPIPGGPVPKSAVSRPDTNRPSIPRVEIPRSRPTSAYLGTSSSAPASGRSTPPPEFVEPRPIIPPASDATYDEAVPAARAPAAPERVPEARDSGEAGKSPGAAGPGPIAANPNAGAVPGAPSGASSAARPRHATLRPATRAPSNGPKLAPLSQPALPPRSSMPGSPAQTDAQALVSKGVARLRAELPEQTSPYADEHLRRVFERARENALTLGFTEEDHIVGFAKCVILVGDDLGSSESKFHDVYYSLNLPGKPPLVRIERALKIAQRINARGGVAVVPIPGPDSGAERPTGEIRVQPPPPSPAPPPAPPASPGPAKGASEDMLPSEPPRPPAQGARPGQRERDVTDPIAPSPSHPAHTPEPPAADSQKLPEIEGFKVLEKIGSGGMGTVYRAYHHRLEVEVAIKVFKTLHPEAKTLLSREARAAARLQHPNIVQVLDYQEFGKGAYFAMQLVKGEDAHELVQRVSGRLVHDAEADGVVRSLGLTNDQLSPEARSILQGKQPWHRLVAWWMAGVADGLDRAHREGIVHRDIKPSNLLLARDGRMTITDFGLALRRDDPTVGGNTARAGTPRYLAPERIADWASGADLSGTDGRIDVWAMGATMYELLTYRPAYDGSREAVMRDIVTIDPLPPSQVIWAVPPEIDRICLQAMKRNPEERFQQAGEMASALRAWLMGESPAAKGPNQPGRWFKKGS